MTSPIPTSSPRRGGRRLGVATAVVLLIGLAGCSSTDQTNDSSPAATPTASAPSSASSETPDEASGDTSSAPSAAAEAVVITIKDFDYDVPDSVAPGTEITVQNDDSVAHTITADEGEAFDVVVAAGETATFTAPTKDASYAFHCTYHGNMTATLVVS